MRIGIDARPLAHPRSGIGRYTEHIIHHLSEVRDWSIVLFSPRALANRWENFETRLYGVRGVPDFAIFQFGLARLCRTSGIDLFFGTRHQLPLYLNCPSVLTIHDLAWRSARKTMKYSGALAESMLTPRAIRIATRIITVSEHTRSELTTFDPAAGTRAATIYEGPCVPTDAPRTGKSKLHPYILAVGTQEPRKNYDRLLHAFRRVASDLPEQHLVIVGGTGWKTDLKALIEELNLSRQVTVIEDSKDDQLASLYAGCSLLAMPSLYEGFGLPLVEAMHYGKPILTSNVSSMPEIAADAALLVDPFDQDSITKGLMDLATNSDLRERLGAKAKLRSARFSWQAAAKDTASVMEAAFAMPINEVTR